MIALGYQVVVMFVDEQIAQHLIIIVVRHMTMVAARPILVMVNFS